MQYSFNDNINTIYNKKIHLDTTILIIISGIIFTLTIAWWIIPIRFISNKYLKNIVFECNKK